MSSTRITSFPPPGGAVSQRYSAGGASQHLPTPSISRNMSHKQTNTPPKKSLLTSTLVRRSPVSASPLTLVPLSRSPKRVEIPSTERTIEAKDIPQPEKVLERTASSSSLASEGNMLGSEEEHIHLLDTSGALGQVVGSQSMLSQELLDLSQPQEELSQDTVMAPEVEAFSSTTGISIHEHVKVKTEACTKSLDTNKNDIEVNDLLTTEELPDSCNTDLDSGEDSSRSSATAYEAAKRIGLLTQVEDDDEEEESPSDSFLSQQSRCDLIIDAAEILAKKEASDNVSLPSSKKRKDATVTSSLEKGRLIPPPKKRKASATTSSEQKEKRRSKAQREHELVQSNYIAQQAAKMAEATINSPEIAKQLLLSMALVRTNPRTPASSYPPSSSVIKDGFFWGTFPPLESILRDHMSEYYELSTTKCQSRDQQSFNNRLVQLIRDKARQQGWVFDPKCFTDKKVRDRIRCFFKTHIQNAKKRLKTMVKNPTKRANAKALAQHMALIEETGKEKLSLANSLTIEKGDYFNNSDGDCDHSQVQIYEDFDTNGAAAVLALGFTRLSQDTQVAS